MRDEPDKRCHIYRLYFNEENPFDIALRRWIWSLPSRNRGQIIKNISKKQLTDWGRMMGPRAKLLVRQVQRRVSPCTLTAPEPAKPIGTSDQIQSMIDRAFPRDLRIIVAMHVDKLVLAGLWVPCILNNFRKPNSVTTFFQVYKPYPWGIRDMLDKIGICSDRNTAPT
jgi:hypothetical protein